MGTRTVSQTINLSVNGKLTIASTLTQNSDQRLKLQFKMLLQK
jgi:hypothetical protein